MPEHETRRVLERELAERGDPKIDVEAIRRQVREAGVGVSVGQMNEGYAAVSAPVLNHDDRLAGSITALGPHSLVDQSPRGSLAKALRETSAEIASALVSARASPELASLRSRTELERKLFCLGHQHLAEPAFRVRSKVRG